MSGLFVNGYRLTSLARTLILSSYVGIISSDSRASKNRLAFKEMD